MQCMQKVPLLNELAVSWRFHRPKCEPVKDFSARGKSDVAVQQTTETGEPTSVVEKLSFGLTN
jgi:hypothetical protein